MKFRIITVSKSVTQLKQKAKENQYENIPSLWSILRDAIICWQSINGKQPELESLLDGGYFPSKNNFTTRLMQNADKESSYTQVLAPWTTRNKGESHD